MLHLEYGLLDDFRSRPDFIFHPNAYFDVDYEDSWLSSDFGRDVIQTIDRIPLQEDVVLSLARHGMRPEDLCTGTKNLFLCKHVDKLNHMSKMGANCFPFLLDIADQKDVYMAVTAPCFMWDEQLKGRAVHFVNDDSFVNTGEDFLHKMLKLECDFA